jgi:hypothetical protein
VVHCSRRQISPFRLQGDVELEAEVDLEVDFAKHAPYSVSEPRAASVAALSFPMRIESAGPRISFEVERLDKVDVKEITL